MKRVCSSAFVVLAMCMAIVLSVGAFNESFSLEIPVYRRDAECNGSVNGQTVSASELLVETNRPGIDPPAYSCSVDFTVFDFDDNSRHGYSSTTGTFYASRTKTLDSDISVDAVIFFYNACGSEILSHWLPESMN